MDSQSKLRALLDAAEGHTYDEVFERLAHGELSEAEAATLRTSEDPDIRRLYELFRPLDDTNKQRFDDAFTQRFAGRAPEVVTKRAPESEVARRRSQPGRPRGLKVGLLLAAAAGLVLYFSFSRPPAQTATRFAQPSPLQFYSLERVVERNAAGDTLLGSDGIKKDAVQLVAGTCWHILLGVPTGGRVPSAVRAFFVKGTSVEPWNTTFVPQADNRNKLAPVGGCAQLPALGPGLWDLVVQSGTEVPSGVPTAAAAACQLGPTADAPWRCDHYSIQVLSP